MPRGAICLLLVLLSTTLFAAGRTDDAIEGRVLYLRYCASCHGTVGDGRGPVAPMLREAPKDLRRLGATYGRPLPRDLIARFVDGREAVAAHGPREMPVWGERFAAPEAEGSGRRAPTDRRIERILAYLDTVQDVPGRPAGAGDGH